MISVKEFQNAMQQDGYFLFENFIGAPLVESLIGALESAYAKCRVIQVENGVENSQGTVHHLICQGPEFLECLSEFERLNPYLESYFEGKYILNSYGGNILRSGESYANNIHRDQRTYSDDFNLMLNTIVMLDDFTEDNGATWLMRSGHVCPYLPTENLFSEHAFQITAPAGSVVVFNSNLWHRAGENKTDMPRRSITPIFARPFVKPGFDYPRVLGSDNKYSEYLQQVLGYNSRIPSSLAEWYRPKEKRFYRSDQG